MQTERYPGQANDETTQLVIHKHWASVMPFLFVAAVIFALCLVAIYYGSSRTGDIGGSVPVFTVALIGLAGMFVACFFLMATIWVWRRNVVVVTDEHIADILQNGLFGRRVSILNLGSIQDISTEVTGPMQTMFHYGTITLQTAGEKDEFVITYMPDPYDNERRIHEIHRRYRHSVGEIDNSPPADPTPRLAKPQSETNPLEEE